MGVLFHQVEKQLCEEVNRMNDGDKCRLQQLWRNRYGFVTAQAAIYDMAFELYCERRMNVNIE